MGFSLTTVALYVKVYFHCGNNCEKTHPMWENADEAKCGKTQQPQQCGKFHITHHVEKLTSTQNVEKHEQKAKFKILSQPFFGNR